MRSAERTCTRRSFAALVLVFALAPLAGMGGCAHFGGGFESPEVFLVGLRALPGGTLEQRFEIDLRLLNPNDTDLELDGIDVTVALNGARLTRGVTGETVSIPRLSDGLVTLTATTTVFDLVNQIMAAGSSTTLDYELRGRVFLANSVRRLHFEKAGQLIPESLGR